MNIKLKRHFVAQNQTIESFSDVKPYFDNLKSRELNSEDKVWQWLLDRSELDAILSENLAWRYIKMNCDTQSKELAESFNTFVSDIEPEIALISNDLDVKFNQSEVLKYVDSAKLFTIIRELKKDITIFRETNVPIEAELQKKEQEYGALSSKMNVNFNGEELTLQAAANFLKDTNPLIRENVYKLINERRLQDADVLNSLLTTLIGMRNQMALNADFNNYVDYKFKSMGRFDYGVDACKEFQTSIAKVVKPLVDSYTERRKIKLGVDVLHPWDLDVDEDLQPALKAFNTTDELIKNAILCFSDLDSEFGTFLQVMHKEGYLDLDSRKGKAPGGFNYPLHESNIPFIYMNATNNLRDLVTMVHEGGHAVHAFLCADLELVDFKDTPAEIAELASMSMELLSMDYWHYFFKNEADLKRAKRLHLEDVLTVLPWVATIDKFQHFLYNNPTHTVAERTQAWLTISKEFSSPLVDYSGIEKYKENQWQKQLHIFEVPFYYIEYGFAQLGAIAVWKNYKENKQKGIDNFKAALKMGYTSPIPDVYKRAGINFDFSEQYIQELMDFVKTELDQLS